MKIKNRHKFIKNLIAPCLMCSMKNKFGLVLEKSKLKPPFLILANHTTDYDAFFVAGAFKCPIYFVMSDHVSSIPVAGKLVKFFVRPLPITKSSLDAGVVREIISVVNQGGAVGIFPEGNKSFAGDMSYIKPTIAKLAKKLNIPVVLFHIEGGYFSQPRWSKTKRKAKIHAYVNEVISPKELEQLSIDEVYNRIVDGIRINAYEVQEKETLHFYGKKLAEGIETMLYACPECGAIGTIRSKDDRFWCSACGDSCTFLDNGHIVGGKFDRLDEWDRWQKKHILDLNLNKRQNDEVILHDPNWIVLEKINKYKNKKLGTYETFLFTDRLLIANKKSRIEIPIPNIVGIGIEGTCGLQISCSDNRVFRLKNVAPVSALKYANFIWTIQNKTIRF